MKVTVTKNLNVRVGEPKLSAPCYQYLAPGTELEIDGKTYKGDKYRGNDNWYRDEANNYYWSGGIKKKTVDIKIDSNQLTAPFKQYQGIPSPKSVLNKNSKNSNWWIHEFGIDQIWKDGVIGQGVNLVVLDTGYASEHPLGSYELLSGWNFDNDSNYFADTNGHGSAVASIINSHANDMIGVAPATSLFVAKSSTHPEWVIKALNKLSSIEDVDIICFSNNYYESIHSKFKVPFLKSIKSNKDSIFICAAGNDGSVNPKIFPASFAQSVSVGSINQDFSISNFSNRGSNIKLYAPGSNLKGLSPNSGHFLSGIKGTSYSAPYVAGVLALLISFAKEAKKDWRDIDPVSSIINTSDIHNHNGNQNYSVINPLAAYNHFKLKILDET